MRLPRFQFTIRRLIVVVMLCAVCLAVLRFHAGLLVAYLLLFLPGFLISRAHGGLGIMGGALSESAFSALLSIGSNLWRAASRSSSLVEAIIVLSSAAFSAAAFGFCLGLLLSIVLGLIIELTRVLLRAIRRVK
jgi:hypothetical protein